MNKEFQEHTIHDLIKCRDELEQIALEEARTPLWRIHERIKEVIKTMEFYYSQGEHDEP